MLGQLTSFHDLRASEEWRRGHFPLVYTPIWQMSGRVRSLTLTFSSPAHLHPCQQGPIHCIAQASVGPVPSAAVGEELYQLCRLPQVVRGEGEGHLSFVYTNTWRTRGAGQAPLLSCPSGQPAHVRPTVGSVMLPW